MAHENRFLSCVQEYREEKAKRIHESRERFECLRNDSEQSIKYKPDPRFECLKGDSYNFPKYESSRSYSSAKPSREYGFPNNYKNKYEKESPQLTNLSKTTVVNSRQSPPYLSKPKQKTLLNINSETQFPSLPSSPKTPKTPKLVIEPLKEEIEFVPLPTSDPRYISMAENCGEEPEVLYQVVRKISGGTWSDRIKRSQPVIQSNVEELNYDEDGFPMIRSIESMINNFS